MTDSSKHKLTLAEKRLALLEMLVKQVDLAFSSVSGISPTDNTRTPIRGFASVTRGGSRMNYVLQVQICGGRFERSVPTVNLLSVRSR